MKLCTCLSMKKGGLYLLRNGLALLLVAWVSLLLVGVQASAGTVIDASKCSNCHDTKLSDFVTPAVKAVDRSTACRSCHGQVNHRYAVVLTEGKFQTADSVNASFSVLHSRHSSRWMGMDNYCGKCHADAKCTTCHVTIPHQRHGSTSYSPDQTFFVADSVTRSVNDLNCTLSQCHGRISTISSTSNPSLTLVPAPAGAAIDALKCSNCHSTKISDFAAPAIKSVDRSAACQSCHGKVDHKYKVVLPQGKFLTTNSVNTPFSSLHTIHAGDGTGKWMAKDHYCGKCHADAACTSCHVSIPHKEHAITSYSPDQTFNVSDGVNRKQNNLNCSLSQCHGRLLNIQ